MANINKNIIMQAGAAVANATNKAAGLSASTPEPGSIISAIQLVNGGRTIGPDALAHFTESVRNKLLSLLVSMEPIQDFNGYGYPWPAGGGKNLWDTKKAYKGVGYNVDIGTVVTLNESQTETVVNNNVISYEISAWGNKVFKTKNLVAGDYTVRVDLRQITNPRVSFYVVGGSDNVISDNYSTTSASIITRTFSVVSDSYILVCIGSNTAQTVVFSNYQIESGSTATSWEPYENVCPISGRTGLSVYVGPTSAIGDAATYSMDWTSPAGTVYAGSADIVTGDIKAAPYYASYNGETLVGPWVSSMDEYDPQGTPTTGAQVVDLGGTMTEYHITGQDIITLVGDNYIGSDSGYVTITE